MQLTRLAGMISKLHALRLLALNAISRLGHSSEKLPRPSLAVARLFCLVTFCTLGGPRAWGQISPDLEQGMKPYGSYHGSSLDHISLSNGNPFFHAGLFSYSQRGSEMAYPMALQYNNQSFTQFQNCQPGQPITQCQTNVVFGPPALTQGVSIGNSVTVGFEGAPFVVGNTLDPGFNTGLSLDGNPIFVQTYSVMTQDGALHELVNTDNGQVALDGSGFSVDKSGILRDSHGTKFLTNGAIEDANGNQMTVSTSAWKDTLGRSLPAMPGPSYPAANPPTSTASLSTCPALGYSHQPVTYAYTWNLPTVNGGTLPLTLCYANVYVRTNFFGGVNSNNWHELSQSFVMLQSVVFPDSTYWAFQYDAADPNNTSSIALADLLKITFPTGGSIAYTWSNRAGADTTNRAVLTRAVDANDGNGPRIWTYNFGSFITVNGNLTQATTVTDPAGNDEVHTMTGLGGKHALYETQAQYFQARTAAARC